MSITDLPGVFLPCVLLSSFLLTLTLTLRLVKILRSLYLHNDFRLTPLSVSKPITPPSFPRLLKTFLPLYGVWGYERPQFEIPQAGHLMLASGHLTVLWAANVGFGRIDEEFNVGNGVAAGVAASCVAVGVTYLFYTRFLHSFNPTECPDLPSQSRTEPLQHSPNRNNDLTTFIDTSVLPKRGRTVFAVQRNEIDWSKAVASLNIETTLLVYISFVIGLNFWSIAMHFTLSPGEIGYGLVLQWLFGAGIDIVLRVAICGLMRLTRAMPRVEERFWRVDLGITVKDLGKYGRKPREEGRGESIKETFFHDQISITPPPTTPRPLGRSTSLLDDPSALPAMTHHNLISQDYSKDLTCILDQVYEENSPFEDLKLSPGKGRSRRESPERGGNEEEEDEESAGMSQDTMPEVPHNMCSPVETPRGYSGFHFYRTPERPLILSPEHSPAKPSIPPKSPTFELHLHAIQVSTDSEPESPHKLPAQFSSVSISDSSSELNAVEVVHNSNTDIVLSEWRDTKPAEDSDELYMVEFLPGGIMTRGELLGSQYDLERRKTEERACVSLFLPRTTQGGTRSVERDPPGFGREDMVLRERNVWVESPKKRIQPNAPTDPSLQSLYTEENRPATVSPFPSLSPIQSSSSKPAKPPANPDSLSDLLQASHIEAEYERISGILAAHEQYRKRKFKPLTGAREAKSVSPYRGWRLGQRLVEEPIGAASKAEDQSSELSLQQASALKALSQIYIQSRPLPQASGHYRSRSQQRVVRDQSQLKSQFRL